MHIALFRSLSARYDAVPAVMLSDTFELLAETRPQTETEVHALAKDFQQYCNDIVDQGVGNISALASQYVVFPVGLNRQSSFAAKSA